MNQIVFSPGIHQMIKLDCVNVYYFEDKDKQISKKICSLMLNQLNGQHEIWALYHFNCNNIFQLSDEGRIIRYVLLSNWL